MKSTILRLGNMKKEKEGNVEDILATGMVLLVILFIAITMIHFVVIQEVKRDISNVARDYMLSLEENGTLTSQSITSLKSNISSLGFDSSHIEVIFNEQEDGTNGQKVDYGEEVNLTIILNTNYQELGLSKVDGIIKDTYEIKKSIYSTSKR